MIVNQHLLLEAAPIKDMLTTKQRHNGVSHGLAEAGYDIRLAEDVQFFPVPGRDHAVNWHVRVDEKTTLGRFALASSVEEFQMPDYLVGRVTDKSTWARKGLSVFNTVIEPGFCGGLTLELVYHGQGTLFIPQGTGIAQVLFSHIEIPAQYEGKYQNQAKGPVPARFENA